MTHSARHVPPPSRRLRRVLTRASASLWIGSLLALPAPAQDAPPQPACHASGTTFVVSRDRVGETGQDIYVTTRPTSASGAPCTYAPKPGDYVIENDSASFLDLQGGMLVLEASTGPDGRLLIYDTARRKKLVDVDYDDARKPVSTPQSIAYWRVGAKPVPSSTCSAAWRAEKDNAAAKRAHRSYEVRFTLADGTARDTGRTGCRLKQEDID